MRELEFLPSWYPHMRRRRRLVILQSYLMFAVAAGLGLWLVLIHRNISLAEAWNANLGAQLAKTHVQLEDLDQQTTRHKELREHDEIFGKLGLHVEVVRMLQALDKAMPREMSLIQLQMGVEESLSKPDVPAARMMPGGADQTIDRRLRVTLQGVAPTDVDLAKFMSRLGAIKYFDHVALNYANEHGDSGHLMREFELTFTVNLNTPPDP